MKNSTSIICYMTGRNTGINSLRLLNTALADGDITHVKKNWAPGGLYLENKGKHKSDGEKDERKWRMEYNADILKTWGVRYPTWSCVFEPVKVPKAKPVEAKLVEEAKPVEANGQGPSPMVRMCLPFVGKAGGFKSAQGAVIKAKLYTGMADFKADWAQARRFHADGTWDSKQAEAKPVEAKPVDPVIAAMAAQLAGLAKAIEAMQS